MVVAAREGTEEVVVAASYLMAEQGVLGVTLKEEVIRAARAMLVILLPHCVLPLQREMAGQEVLAATLVRRAIRAGLEIPPTHLLAATVVLKVLRETTPKAIQI
jgi:hypothetical protein